MIIGPVLSTDRIIHISPKKTEYGNENVFHDEDTEKDKNNDEKIRK